MMRHNMPMLTPTATMLDWTESDDESACVVDVGMVSGQRLSSVELTGECGGGSPLPGDVGGVEIAVGETIAQSAVQVTVLSTVVVSVTVSVNVTATVEVEIEGDASGFRRRAAADRDTHDEDSGNLD